MKLASPITIAVRLRQCRLMVSKAPNRTAVHGEKLPVTTIINEEEVEREIEKGRQEKEKKRREIEQKIDSQIKQSQLPTETPTI